MRDSGRHLWVRLVTKSTSLVLVGVSVGLFANALGTPAGVSRLFKHFSWPTLVIIVTIGVLVYEFSMDFRDQASRISLEDAQRQAAGDQVSAGISEMLVPLIKLECVSVAFPRVSASLNLHVYLAEDLEGRVVLRKRRDLGFNFEVFPTGHTLDYADPAVDDLAICEAYRSDSVVYTLVDPGHQYGSRINNRVDRKIGWVMGVPIHHVDHEPYGVICAFGTKPPFQSDSARRLFEQCLVDGASIIASGLALPQRVREG